MRLKEQQARTWPQSPIIPMGRPKKNTATRGADHTKSKKDSREQQQKQQQQLDDESSQAYRPKRKATNAHNFRYLQTRNPDRLEEEDLKKALEASLEECPDFGWPAEDSASCSSSDQSNAPSASSNSSTGAGCSSPKNCTSTGLMKHKHGNSSKNRRQSVEKSSRSKPYATAGSNKRGPKSSTSSMQLNHHSLCNCHINQRNNSNQHYHPHQNSHPSAASHKNGSSNHCLANVHNCPMFSVHNRYKPVGKKNIYNEADFFHEGIMEYIEYELLKKGLIRQMELPHIGEHCALTQCNQLDFLPVKCDACSKVFCLEHYRYETHGCETSKNKDFQVPVCPLCMQPVVGKRDQLPDLAVSQHIDQYCTKNELLRNYRRQKAATKSNLQACSYKSCKQKDLIYLECSDCRAKFCIKHRHPGDHSCAGPTTTIGSNIANNWSSIKDTCSSNASSSYSMIKNKAQQITRSGQAALNRITSNSGGSQANRARSSNDTTTHSNNNGSVVSSLQGNLSEQEALAIAMRESVGDVQVISPDEDDAVLARVIHQSEIEARNRPRTGASNGGGSQKDTCILI